MSNALRGRVLVGQSGGPTAVINTSLFGVIEAAAQHDEITGVYGMVRGIEGLLKGDLIDLRKEDPGTLQRLWSAPASILGSCRYKIQEEDYPRILDILRAADIRYFFYIGGNGSQYTSERIAEEAARIGYDLRVVGIPKTIDNDLNYTDHTPGYGSIARFTAVSLMCDGRDSWSLATVDRVKIFETLGRDTGWVTMTAAFARQHPDDPPHLIYTPERPFIPDQFLQDIQRVVDRLGYCVVAVGEGLTDTEGRLVSESLLEVKDFDAYGRLQLGNVSVPLSNLVAGKLGLKTRNDKPGMLMRVFEPLVSEVDRSEAYQVGYQAVEAAIQGQSGVMTTIIRDSDEPYRSHTGLVELSKVARGTKHVPPEFINAEGNDVTQAFLDYVRPLLGSPLPEYPRLKMERVALPSFGN